MKPLARYLSSEFLPSRGEFFSISPPSEWRTSARRVLAERKTPSDQTLTRKGIAFIEVVPNVTAGILVGLTVQKVRRGSVVYTDRYRSYDRLMCCGYKHLRVDHSKEFRCSSNKKVPINGLEGFWSWAKERLFKHHGISLRLFPLYLKKLEPSLRKEFIGLREEDFS